MLADIQTAVWSNRIIQIRYRRADGTVVERTISPLGLVAKGQTWYLVGSVDDALRTYRISRMIEIEIQEMTGVRPPQFDLRSYWETSTSEFQATLPSFDVCVEVTGHLLKRVSFELGFARTLAIGETGPDGWTPVRMDFGIREEACGFVIRYAADIRSVRPEDLVDEALEKAQFLIDRFSRPEPDLKAG